MTVEIKINCFFSLKPLIRGKVSSINNRIFSLNFSTLEMAGDGLPEEDSAEDVPEHALQPHKLHHPAVPRRTLLQV